MSENYEFCIKNEGSCTKNEGFFNIKNEQLCVENDEFCRFALTDAKARNVSLEAAHDIFHCSVQVRIQAHFPPDLT